MIEEGAAVFLCSDMLSPGQAENAAVAQNLRHSASQTAGSTYRAVHMRNGIGEDTWRAGTSVRRRSQTITPQSAGPSADKRD